MFGLLAYEMGGINGEMFNDGENDMGYIENPVRARFRSRRSCLPPSCVGNCYSGNCAYWCNLCYGK
ncbi:unnamed protein product [Meloidogyne enterolobii]|uniref:Uncharacterized protein n=1 Tax=Meloidogyne enterolobii TaxID=390850 RepID=A0ACB0Y932_MELEN